ncbi:MAG: aminotransferase class III-fold pyridoxal phosphate-dependent enzyme [Pirellulales bacterium]|nr:aminotransferase class III-fold pyridoxal phosphate-dependent enzyme [Pirellulales bacterium]
MIIEDIRDRPAVSQQQASQIALEHFGLNVISVKELDSERDRNFQLSCDDEQQYVLKIAHPAASRDLLECQNAMLERLTTELPRRLTPRIVPSTTGSTLVDVVDLGPQKLTVRLLEYLPGTPLARVTPHSSALMKQVGRTLAEVDQALVGFEHPAAHREFLWDLRRGEQTIAENANHIIAPDQQAIVAHFTQRFAEVELSQRLAGLRQSIIHNDGNDYNLLASFQCPAPGDGGRSSDAGEAHGLSITGLIDLGDIVHTALVCEVAVGCAYALLDKDDPLATACDVVAGYHEVLPLTADELAVIFDLICLRLCVSVCMSARQGSQATENEYLLVSQQSAWQALKKLRSIHPRWAEYRFRLVCGLEPCQQSSSVTNWIRQQQNEFAYVLPAELMTGPRMTFDLSVASGDFDSFEQMADPEQLTAAMFGMMEQSGVPLGIGRYDEPRTVYASDVFAPAGNPNAEWRTIHVGIDLFAVAGTPVFAPCDGVVYGMQNNANPLDYGPTIILRHDVPAAEQGDQYATISFWTLYGHLSCESLDKLTVGQKITRGQQIATLGDLPVNGGWPPHLHFQLIVDPLDATGDFPGVGRGSDRALWHSLSPNPALMLRLSHDEATYGETSTTEIRQQRGDKLGRNLSLSYQQPLRIVRGHRQFLLDSQGRRYLDCVNNVAHVGHCHPHVVDAAKRQQALLNTNTRYLHPQIVKYARQLTELFPDPLSVCFFVNSGSEANDLALRLAWAATGARHVIAVDHAYHGNLSSLIEISAYKCNGPGGEGPGAKTTIVPGPDVYRGQHRGTDAGARYAEHVSQAVESLRQQGTPPAAFICESILSCGGQIVLPESYLQNAYAAVHAAGGVCIADEVQVGFGRVGEAFWGFELQDVVPDIVTLGKPIGGGHPLGAVVTTPEIAAAFDNGMEYFNTFGGNPVSCGVGLAVLDVIRDEGLQANALEVGNSLRARFVELMSRFPLVGDVRGKGLFLGLEFVNDRQTRDPAARQATYIVERAKEHGILLSTDGPLHNVIKIKPPLCFQHADADRLVQTLEKVLAEMPAQPS